MVLDPMAVVGRREREKGHRWAEALSSVEVLRVNQVSVKLTLMSHPTSNQTQELCKREFLAPKALLFISLMRDYTV